MPTPRQLRATLYHLTTTTGHVSQTSRADVADGVIAYLRPKVAAGKGRIRGPVRWWLHVRARGRGWALYTLAGTDTSAPTAPALNVTYVTCVGCWRPAGSAAAWSHVLGRAGSDPPPIPWLAVTLASPLVLHRLGAEVVGGLGDLERCLFWTLAELDEPT